MRLPILVFVLAAIIMTNCTSTEVDIEQKTAESICGECASKFIAITNEMREQRNEPDILKEKMAELSIIHDELRSCVENKTKKSIAFKDSVKSILSDICPEVYDLVRGF